jgi:hypothetical protein
MLRLVIKALALAGAVSAVVVTSGAEGGVQPRKEIRDLAKNKDEFDLYIQALTSFQAVDQKNITSYYGVAGKSSDLAMTGMT